MNISKISPIKEVFYEEFSKFGKVFQKSIWISTLSFFYSQSASLSQTALAMGNLNGKSFKVNEQKLQRFMQNSNFIVGDKLWRCHHNLIFKLLEQLKIINKGCPIPINVDFTTKSDEFLILSASIPFMGRAIPLYFSMRCYPKEKGMSDQKKQEKAFMKELKHLLPKGYTYVIVADRGFGNTRFIELCLEIGFHYIFRTQNNWTIEIRGRKTNLKFLPKENYDREIVLSMSKIKTRLVTSFLDDGKGWYIFSSLSDSAYEELINHYKNRFCCEKMFQDQKGSGFEIEKSKITDYSRFKRLLFCVYLAQTLTMLLGERIEHEAKELKKN